jgi:hypothetical protein
LASWQRLGFCDCGLHMLNAILNLLRDPSDAQ